MQDNARPHVAKATIKALRQRDITFFDWPAFSPDLNPIEHIWNWMKEWIEEHYQEEALSNYSTLREAVCKAWDAVPSEYLESLISSMKRRCEAVIAANGLFTKY